MKTFVLVNIPVLISTMRKNVFEYAKCLVILLIAAGFISCDKQSSFVNPEEFELGQLQKELGDCVVQAIAFDTKGNAWIGAFELEVPQDENQKPEARHYIVRHNAQETVFYNTDNSVIPKDFWIWDIAVDKQDNVWIGGTGGLLKYDGKVFSFFNSQNSAMPEDVVSSIAVDSKNNIWLASCRHKQGGLVKYDGTKWTAFTPDNSALPDNSINDIATDQSDNVWLTVNDYLVKFSGNKWNVYDKNDLGLSNFIFSGIQFNSNNMLIGINDHSFNGLMIQPPCELFSFDGKKSTILSTIDNITSIPGRTKITIDQNDNVWCYSVGSMNFGGVWNGDKWVLLDSSEFGGSRVWVIKEDTEGRMWFGTENGIYIK